MGRFAECFAEVSDPRGRNAQHDFIEILFIALLAQLCGAESCVDMADFAEAKCDVLGEILDLKYGTPSHDTFSRVFPDARSGFVRGWFSAVYCNFWP